MNERYEEDLAYVRGRYQKRIATDGTTFKSMNSGTEEKQRIRHAVHQSIIRTGNSILDVGCGIGQFYKSVRDRDPSVEYTGVDIVPEYIEHCKTSFPDAKFELRNIFEKGIGGEFDVIVASQVFNARYPNNDNLEILKLFLTTAFQHARVGVTVDMLTSYADFNQPELYYYSPEAIFQHAKSLSRLVALRHDYLPFEFTVQVLKNPL
jgi:SAM-dependent methyltransferase